MSLDVPLGRCYINQSGTPLVEGGAPFRQALLEGALSPRKHCRTRQELLSERGGARGTCTLGRQVGSRPSVTMTRPTRNRGLGQIVRALFCRSGSPPDRSVKFQKTVALEPAQLRGEARSLNDYVMFFSDQSDDLMGVSAVLALGEDVYYKLLDGHFGAGDWSVVAWDLCRRRTRPISFLCHLQSIQLRAQLRHLALNQGPALCDHGEEVR